MMKVTIEKKVEMDYALNEAFKTLRTNLQFCGDDVKVIMLTSCTPNEGKTTVSYNLCTTLAADGKKVILVDADLRKSVLVGRYGITAKEEIKGLSHYLSGQEKIEQVICDIGVENMSMILAGPSTPNPTELLGNKYFTRLMETLRESYDYVVVDAPPLGSVIDAAIISKECDGSILVIESNAISYKFAQKVKKQLEMTECKILGSILNKVNVGQGGYYHGYYSSKYYRRYGGKYYGNRYYGKKYGNYYGNEEDRKEV